MAKRSAKQRGQIPKKLKKGLLSPSTQQPEIHVKAR